MDLQEALKTNIRDHCHVCTYINTICYTVYGVKTKIYGCYVNFFMYCLNSKKVCFHVLIPCTKHSIIELILISFSTGLFNLILLNRNLLQVKCQIANHMPSNTPGRWKRLKQRHSELLAVPSMEKVIQNKKYETNGH